MMDRQWHQLDHGQIICQQCQSIEGTVQNTFNIKIIITTVTIITTSKINKQYIDYSTMWLEIQRGWRWYKQTRREQIVI